MGNNVNDLANDKNGNLVKHTNNKLAANGNTADDPRIHLIRVRNPWGDKNEWRGRYKYNILCVYYIALISPLPLHSNK